ncbi:ribonuclease D [Candidatus Thioglobus sp.]|nr:ribonuclease D [Candidatus Thioglobus sp.]MDB4099280.1 ribonuclease D [Candidatus Thioglobus sp.]
MISSETQLNKYLQSIHNDSLLAIDTEFRRIDSYFPELCLIQIAAGNYLECIDVLAIKNLEPLFEKLYDSKVIWVIHSARQDIEALYHLSQRIPHKIFDTQIAASLLNYPLQISYQLLTETLQNVYLEKKYTRFDWKARPLPEDVLQYALDDVKYLLPHYKILNAELIKSEKLQWLWEETDFLLDKNLYGPNFKQIIKKTSGISKIDSDSQRQAINLVMWREDTAKKENKPRKWIMSDERLIDYATGKNKLSSSPKKLFEKFLKTNQTEKKLQAPLITQKPLSADEKLKKNHAQDYIKKISIEYDIAPELICSSKNLVKFIRGDKEVSINRGWRSKIFKLKSYLET